MIVRQWRFAITGRAAIRMAVFLNAVLMLD
jgi:hypothetical protein